MAQHAQKFNPPPSFTEEPLVSIEMVTPHLAAKADIALLQGNIKTQMLAPENRLIKCLTGTAAAMLGVFPSAQIGRF